jgi:hypothetical protein
MTEPEPKQAGLHSFKVRTFGDGPPWIFLEPRRKRLDLLTRVLAIDLKVGTTIEEARKLAKLLNRHVAAIAQASISLEMKDRSAGETAARFRAAIANRPLSKPLAKRLGASRTISEANDLVATRLRAMRSSRPKEESGESH